MSTSTATPQLPATAAPVPSQHTNQVLQIQPTATTSWKDQIYLDAARLAVIYCFFMILFSIATLAFLFYGSVAAAGGSFAAVTLFAYKLK